MNYFKFLNVENTFVKEASCSPNVCVKELFLIIHPKGTFLEKSKYLQAKGKLRYNAMNLLTK